MQFIGFLPLVSVSLLAQAPTHHYNWVRVESPALTEASSNAKFDLRYALHHNAGGWQLVIKNFSDIPVTFRYWIPGVEQSEHAMTNPLMHLSAGAMVHLFPEQPPTGLQVMHLAPERGFSSPAR